MMYSHKHRYIYMAPPKTGTTSITSILREHYDGSYWDFTGVVPIRKSKDDPQGYIWPRHLIHVPEQIKDYFIFASIRNPYRHVMSQYWNLSFVKNLEMSMKNFHYFIDVQLGGSLFWWLKISENYEPPKGCVRFKVDQYIKTDEGLTEQFNQLPFVKQKVMMPHYKRSIKAGLFYTQEMADMVLEKRKNDFEYFGFDTELPSDLREPCL